MPTLRLTQSTLSEESFRVEAALEDNGKRRITATEFAFPITPQDREDLRWYLEDYLQYAADPAPKIAARIEKRIAEMGVDLFKAIFQTNDDTRDLWVGVRDRLDETRVEIVSDVSEGTSVPWELLRDPKTDTPLSLSAKAFVRAAHQSARQPRMVERSAGPIRILLVICRPAGDADVPFRSVASRLIKALGGPAREALDLHVLRPPTFAQLSAELRRAKTAGSPYHVVHFDGHGGFFDSGDLGGQQTASFLTAPRSGPHGYLVFENSAIKGNRQYVDGPALGSLLWETGVPVLVLNACRSAHAEPPAQPESAPMRDIHAEARAFGSLAQELVDAGIAGVVAMRYNVYVVTAAQFVANLYESLANGETLGEAVTLGRKQLVAQPLREIAYAPRPLQDWMVPIVHEAAPIALFPRPPRKAELNIRISGDAAAHFSEALPHEVEKRPDVGFFGRDETLLAIDRAFDTQPIVLLHAYAGSGKTSTVAEFARWYRLTGGIDGPVLFTSFEQYKTLAQVLNESIGRVFADSLARADIQWMALDDEQRRSVALSVLSQIPVLWIWDNVEPISGFPAGTPSSWSDDEQEALADFLRAAMQTKTKLLLTSRRDERAWLGDLPARTQVPPMPMQERVQLARALAVKHGRQLADVDDWMPLLRFTRGNPMTITVLVGQALRDGLRTKAQIEGFVGRLRSGEAAFDDEASEGRDRSLGASLAYGFDYAFADAERRQLALLHFFQGFVDVDVLAWMGNAETPWCLPEVRGLTREVWMALLDRAADIGLLTSNGGGYYSIHPALPWFFRSLFESHYPSGATDEQPSRLKATRAFVEAMGVLGNYYLEQFDEGNRAVIQTLSAEETNLLHGWRLGRQHGWYAQVLSAMQGLRRLYDQTGRRAEWARLIAEIVSEFVDATSDGPFPGREDEWGLVTEYRIRLARESRNWQEAERLQRFHTDWARQRATPALAVLDEALDSFQRHTIRTLATSLHGLGEIQRALGRSECAQSYSESLKLAEKIGDVAGVAACAFNLGQAYDGLLAIRDLDAAEHWYRSSLELKEERDSQGRALCIGQLGFVAYKRFQEGRSAQQPEPELLSYLNAALRLNYDALGLLPPHAVNVLQSIHGRLGSINADAGDCDRALSHWYEALRYSEASDDAFSAGQTCFNVARLFAQQGRFIDAREYALAALRNFEPYGAGAVKNIKDTQQLLSMIDEALQPQSGDER